MEVLLRQYETVGTLESSFAKYEPLNAVDKDSVFLPEHCIPLLRSYLDGPDHEEKGVEMLQQAAKDNEGCLTPGFASRLKKTGNILLYSSFFQYPYLRKAV